MMATFRPRIGKQKIKRFDRLLGKQIAHRVGNFDIQNAHIFERSRFAGGFLDAAGQFIDPEKISIWISLRELADKRTVATAKVDI